jgi:PAS domain S-box-containing protein
LSSANLSNAGLSGADLTEADLTGSIVTANESLISRLTIPTMNELDSFESLDRPLTPNQLPVSRPLRVLFVDDSEDDVFLIQRELRQGNYNLISERVETPEAMWAALESQVWDIILCDHHMPRFSAPAALAVLKNTDLDLPFIAVSHGMGRDTAISLMRAGAHDYVEKSDLTRLLPAIERELREAAVRREREAAGASLRESQQRFESLVNSVDGIVWEANATTFEFTFVSEQAQRLLGYPVERWLTEPTFWREHIHPDERDWAVNFCVTATAEGRAHTFEYRMLTVDGRYIWLRDIVSVIVEGGRSVRLRGVMVDITDRKQRERELEAIAAVSAALRAASNRAGMIPVVLDQLLNLLNADGAALALCDPATGESVIEANVGVWADAPTIRLAPGVGVVGRVVATGESYLNNDAQDDPLFARPDMLAGMSALVCVPLIAREQTMGALLAIRRTEINDAELRLLNAIANIAANALYRSDLHEQTEQRLRRLAALRAIDQAITGSLDLQIVLQILVDQVIAELDMDASSVLLFNAQTHHLEYAAGRGFHAPPAKQARIHISNSLPGEAVLTRSLIALPDLKPADLKTKRTQFLTDEGFSAYFAIPLIAKGRIEGVLEVFRRTPLTVNSEWLDFLETLAGQAAIAIDNASLFTNLQRSNAELSLAYDATIEGWSRALDLRDKETEGHTRRVTDMTVRLACEMGVHEDQLVHIYRGALLHDIGKVAISDTILLKPGSLTAEEMAIMRRHPAYAHEMLSPIAYLRPALDIPYCHHEKWDGTGYPRGLKGEEIPLVARIFAIADVWDALCSDRPYRQAWTPEAARAYILAQSGSHFEPRVVEAFLRLLDEAKNS